MPAFRLGRWDRVAVADVDKMENANLNAFATLTQGPTIQITATLPYKPLPHRHTIGMAMLSPQKRRLVGTTHTAGSVLYGDGSHLYGADVTAVAPALPPSHTSSPPAPPSRPNSRETSPVGMMRAALRQSDRSQAAQLRLLDPEAPVEGSGWEEGACVFCGATRPHTPVVAPCGHHACYFCQARAKMASPRARCPRCTKRLTAS